MHQPSAKRLRAMPPYMKQLKNIDHAVNGAKAKDIDKMLSTYQLKELTDDQRSMAIESVTNDLRNVNLLVEMLSKVVQRIAAEPVATIETLRRVKGEAFLKSIRVKIATVTDAHQELAHLFKVDPPETQNLFQIPKPEPE